MGKRAIIYARVSTDEQSDGLDYQQKRCHEYASASDLDILDVLCDENVSGKIPIAERPGGEKLWRMVSQRRATDVVVVRGDRLSRDEYGVEAGRFLKHCDQNGVTLHLADRGGAVRGDMAGRLLLILEDIKGGEDRKTIASNLVNGRRHAAQLGRLVLCGNTPYGYDKKIELEFDPVTRREKTRLYLAKNPEQVKVILWIYRKLLDDHWSLHAIARDLNRRGVPSPRSNKKPRPGKGVSEWHVSRLRDILTSPKYAGQFSYDGFTIEQPELAIVDRAMQTRAKEILTQNKLDSPRRTQHQYLFRSRLYCTCGRKYRGRMIKSRKQRYQYYVCGALGHDGHGKCTYRKAINTRYIDDAAWAELVKTLNDSSLVKEAAQAYVKEQGARLQPKRERLELAVSEHADAERMSNEYVRLAARAGLDKKEELEAKYEHEASAELERVKRLSIEIETLQDELSQVARYDEKEVDRVLTEFRRKLAKGVPTFVEKRKFIEWANVIGKLEGEDVKFGLEIGVTFSVLRSVSRPKR